MCVVLESPCNNNQVNTSFESNSSNFTFIDIWSEWESGRRWNECVRAGDRERKRTCGIPCLPYYLYTRSVCVYVWYETFVLYVPICIAMVCFAGGYIVSNAVAVVTSRTFSDLITIQHYDLCSLFFIAHFIHTHTHTLADTSALRNCKSPCSEHGMCSFTHNSLNCV